MRSQGRVGALLLIVGKGSPLGVLVMIFNSDYFQKRSNHLSQAEVMMAYMGGSTVQTIVDNPVTAYRQLVQQYARTEAGTLVDPRQSALEARRVFMSRPFAASTSGLFPRLVGVGTKRIPKFGFLLGISYCVGDGSNVGMLAATGASILSAPFINPIRMIEKQQRAHFRTTGTAMSVTDIVRQSAEQKFRPLFRGTVPLMGHSLASATTGLVGQPQLQKHIKEYLGTTTQLGSSASGLIASSVVSPIYVIMTNPISRLEVIMQTRDIGKSRISLADALRELAHDSKQFGIRGMLRGQGIGIAKAILSLSLFHESRIFITEWIRTRNIARGY